MKKQILFPIIVLLLVLSVIGVILFTQNPAPSTPVNQTSSITITPTVSSSISPTSVSQLPTKYITAQDWPPKVNVENKAFSCIQAGSTNSPAGQTKQITINGHIYCVTVESEGAAGSIYSQYAYARPQGNTTQIFTFTLRFVQCENYPQPQMTECQSERNNFNVDNFTDSYIQTNY